MGKKDIVDEHIPTQIELSEKYRISVEELRVLFEKKSDVEGIEKLGGVKGIAEKLKTDLENGLSQEEVDDDFKERSLYYGINKFNEPPTTGFFKFVWEAYREPIMIILTVFAVISIALGAPFPKPGHETTFWIEGAAVLVAVALVALVGGSQNWSKERQFKKLNKVKNDRTVKVIRGGKTVTVSISQIQCGDIVSLEQGDYIPADGIWINGHGTSCDESAMTGESDNVKKNEKKPFMLSGTTVAEGNAVMLVIAVGMNSEWGITYQELVVPREDTPLQISLGVLAKNVGWIGTAIAIAVFIVLTIRFIVENVQNRDNWQNRNLTDFIHFTITAGSLIVVAVPEGLPLAVTICLAYSMKSMLKDKNLVRHLNACETMGGATNICSDKTGTLTENRMSVTNVWIAGKYFTKEEDKLEPKLKEKLEEPLLKLMIDCICLNSSNSYLKFTEEKGSRPDFIGNKTECAMLLLTHRLGFDYNKIRKSGEVLHLFPFSSEKKRMSVIVKHEDAGLMFTKGASEIVLGMCKEFIKNDGSFETIDEDTKGVLKKKIEEMASDGLRTLCLAYKELKNVEKEYEKAPEENLILIGIVGIQDPLRVEVPEAIQKCKKAGITVRMVTGDNKLTATRIAKDCGIYEENSGHVVLEGEVFRKMSNQELDAILPNLRVLARSAPLDKHKLVTRLKDLGEVVAVTGDGTNDGPALKAANIGLAMGIAGTDIAKEACDIIIMDDNFASIVKAVMWGRAVRGNIQKFLQFQLTINFVALLTTFFGVVTGYGEPLQPIQLLWVNLIQDSLAALALATEKPTEDLLNNKPCGRLERLIMPVMWRNMVCTGLFQLGVIFMVLYAGASIFPLNETMTLTEKKDFPSVHYTMVFNTFVWLQIFNEFNARKLDSDWNVVRGLFVLDNWMTVATMAFTIGLQIIIVQLGGIAMSTKPLDGPQWGI